jgi:hypothetical protein
MIKAIETAAFGRLFRSRHEARVACFLTYLGARWEYEPQGFELPSGRYLPDFKVYYYDRPQEWFWVECKPFEPTDHEIALARQLSDNTRCAVLFFTPSTFDEIRHYYFSMSNICEEFGWEKDGDFNLMMLKIELWDRHSFIDNKAGKLLSYDLVPKWNWMKSFKAANAALSQRFEFGEAPA